MPIIQHLGTAFASGGGGNIDPLLAGGGLYFGPYAANGTALTGYLGPVKADLRTYYKSILSWGTWVDDDAFFNTTSTGIQVWSVPESRVYRITMESASHAHGGNRTGWKMEFNRAFTAGDRLFILPGHRCSPTTDGNTSFGGNGGTFLVLGNSSESNLDTDLLNRNVSDVIAVCGGAAKANNSVGDAPGPGSHPSGSDLETSVNNGSGRGIANIHNLPDGGPSGGAGFLKGACQHNAQGNQFFIYSDKQDSTSFIYDADSFVRGGLGGRGYYHGQHSNPSNLGQSNNGMNGSGGFGGGGGQSVDNSYSSGAGGMMGGCENDGATIYPNSYKYQNGSDRIAGGSSYIKSGITLITNQSGVGATSYVKIKNN